MQLNHAGRKAGTYKPWDGFGALDRSVPVEGEEHWQVIGPSAIEYLPGWPLPEPMSLDDIATVREAWVAAARRALEISEAVRRVSPSNKPLFFRVSAVDEGGWTLDDTVVLARELKAVGVDAIDCSASGIAIRSPTASRMAPQLGFQVPYAERVRKEAGILSVAVGLIVEARQTEAILGEGRADMVAIGREMLLHPFWPAHAARILEADPEFKRLPVQYGWWLDRRKKTGYDG